VAILSAYHSALLIAFALLAAAAPKPPPDPIYLALSATTPAVSARADTDHPSAARPAARGKKGEPVRIRWFVQNRAKAERLPESVFHFLVTRIDQSGRDLPREPAPGSLADNSYAADLAGGASTGGSARIPIDQAGLYLVQFEILNRAGVRQQHVAVEVTVE
jgi:hypothetical protein